MSKFRRAAVVAVLVGAIGGAAWPASADPTGSKNAFAFTANCDGRTVQFVVNSANGQGRGTENGEQAVFSPALVIGTNEVFLPTAFDLTFTFTPTGGTRFTFTIDNERKNQQGGTTCSLNSTGADPHGTFTIVGTVEGNFR